MKKWLIIMIACFLIIVIGSTTLYLKATHPVRAAKETAIDEAKNKANIVSQQKVYMYNGSESAYVVVGKQQSGKKVVIWLPRKKGEKSFQYNWNDGISQQTAQTRLSELKTPKKIISIKLGIESNNPVWEITFLDNQSKLNYFYTDFLKSSNHSKLIENI